MNKFLVFLLLFKNCQSLKDIPERARSGEAWKASKGIEIVKSRDQESSSPLIWQTKLDHFDNENTFTFSQRYYVGTKMKFSC